MAAWLLALALGCASPQVSPADPYDCMYGSAAGDGALRRAVLRLYPDTFYDAELVASPERWSDEEFVDWESQVLLVKVTRFGAVELDGILCPVVGVHRVILGMPCPRGNNSLLILKGAEPIWSDHTSFASAACVFPPTCVEFPGLRYRFNLAEPKDLKLLQTEGLWGTYELVEGSIK